MRVNTVLRALLLLCALAAADAARCDKSMIHGPEDEYEYDRTKKLSCRSDNKTLRAIEFNSKRYTSLTCDETKGWKSGDEKVADASSPLSFTCVEYCALIGTDKKDLSKIFKKVHPLENYKHAICDGITSVRFIYKSRVLQTHEIYCDIDSWYNDRGIITKDTATPQHFECLPKCTRFQHSIDVKPVVLNNKTMETVFKCDNIGKNGGIRLNEGSIFSEIKCHYMAGYTADGITLAESMDMVRLSCESELDNSSMRYKNRCGRSLINGPEEGSGSTIEYKNRRLSCINIHPQAFLLEAVTVNSKRFEFIECDDEAGWKGRISALNEEEGGIMEPIADAASALNVTCEDYCNVNSIESNSMRVETKNFKRTVKCANPSEKLFLDGHIPVQGNNASCNISSGWISILGGQKLIRDNKIDRVEDFECRKACEPERQESDVEVIVLSTLTKRKLFKCKEFDGQPNNYGIRINGGASVFREIICEYNHEEHISGYWANGAKLAGPHDSVSITCGYENPTTKAVPTYPPLIPTSPSTPSTSSGNESVSSSTTTTSAPIEQSSVQSAANTSVPLVVGGSIVGVLILCAVVVAVVFLLKRRARQNANQSKKNVQKEGCSSRKSKKDEQKSKNISSDGPSEKLKKDVKPSEQKSINTNSEGPSEKSKKVAKPNSKTTYSEGASGKSKTASERSKKSTHSEVSSNP